MALMRSYCPHCGKVVPAGQRCKCRPRSPRRPTPGDSTRSEREPWRKNYSTREYQQARQAAIARSEGRCVDCGRICARRDGDRWVTLGMGGEVDHVDALCDGGTNDSRNLQLRCKSCHAKRDARRRRAARRAP